MSSINPVVVRARIEALLNAFPELADDDQLRADMIEGETDFAAVLSSLVRLRNERLALADGLAAYMSDLSDRKARLLRGADGLKKLIFELLSVARLKNVALPEATVSVTPGRNSVEVTDADELPQGYFALVRQPDKAAIKAALESGERIPGARLVEGEPSVTIRIK